MLRDACSRRSAYIGESGALSGKTVEVWSLDALASVAADKLAKVIRNEEKNILVRRCHPACKSNA